jgi:GntR family transcriptional regulator, transcriptional repressor for pyruvate dehydrogenase complex
VGPPPISTFFFRNQFAIDKKSYVLYMTFTMGQPLFFKPLKSEKKIFQQISDQVRDLIFSGVLKPGDKLPPEKQLASQFQTGRMVVREALRTLEQSGLVHIKQGSLGGAFVKDPDTTVITRSISDLIKIGSVTLRELTEARLGIEKVILEFAIMRMNDEDLDLLKKNIEDSEQKFLKGERATEEHIRFHILLSKSTQNLLFEMMIESIMNVTKSFLLSLKPDVNYINNVLTYHKEIYLALREKNLPMAEQIMEKHLLDINRKFKDLAKT